jgi:uncharacterized protein with beta-barrel porin domain
VTPDVRAPCCSWPLAFFWHSRPPARRCTWAHDWISGAALGAVFETLPGEAPFTVTGATTPPNSALTTVGAKVFLTTNWTLLAKFGGQFANNSQTYAGSGTLRYSW